MTNPSETALSAEEPVLRLTGKQIESIDPPPEGDWFVDFDEFEEFVPKRLLDAARSQPATEGLREALEQTYDVLARLDAQANDGGGQRRQVYITVEAWLTAIRPAIAKARAALAATEPAK